MRGAVRRLTTNDGAAYRAIRLEALQSSPSAYGTSHAEALARPLSYYTRMIGDHAVFGAFEGTGLAGIASFAQADNAHSRHLGHLLQLFVRTAHHRSGHGMALIDAVLGHAANHVEQVFLGVGTHNEAALALYEKAGFAIYGTEPRALKIDGRYYDEHLMVKFLDQKGHI